MIDVTAAPLDTLTRVLTTVAVALFTLIAVGLVVVPAPDLGVRVIIAAFFVAIVVATWAFAPKSYAIGSGQLVVARRGVGPRTYVLDPGPPERWTQVRGIRLLGSGGLFGYFGLFWSRELGRFHVHVTDRHRAVGFRTAQGPVVISPTDPDGFLASWTS